MISKKQHDKNHLKTGVKCLFVPAAVFYLCCMQPEDEVQLHWLNLLDKLEERHKVKPDLDGVLLQIGIRESGMPPKEFTAYEKTNLVQMAVCTVLVPARYYELFWVEDSGWPHYKQLMREPEITPQQRDDFLKPYILQYVSKNKMA